MYDIRTVLYVHQLTEFMFVRRICKNYMHFKYFFGTCTRRSVTLMYETYEKKEEKEQYVHKFIIYFYKKHFFFSIPVEGTCKFLAKVWFEEDEEEF